MKSPHLPEFWVSKARLETLFDGVFAIAMTLMVLEIKIPELKDPKSLPEFAAAMKHNVSGVIAFALSMIMLGVFWYRHHRQYHFIARITPGLLAINLAFLTVVAFFPFAAGIFGKYPQNWGAYMVYMPTGLLLVALVSLQWIHARHHGLLLPELSPEGARLIHLGNVLALGMVTAVTVLYLGTILAIIHFQLDKEFLGFAGVCMVPLGLSAKWWRRRLGLA